MTAIDITPILNAMVALAAALISAVVVPWLRSKLTAEQTKELLRWAEIGVEAAEQLYATGEGEKKKAYVLQLLKNKGCSVNEEEVETAIEAAVLKLHKELYGGAADGEQS